MKSLKMINNDVKRCLGTFNKNHYITIVVFFVILVSLDQIIKIIAMKNMYMYQAIEILPFFNILLILNKGVSFSMFNFLDYKVLLLMSLGAFVIASYVILSVFKKVSLALILILIFLSAGTFGNLIDRVIYQGVVDYLHLHYKGYNFPIFNFADILITFCGILLVKEVFLDSKKGDL